MREAYTKDMYVTLITMGTELAQYNIVQMVLLPLCAQRTCTCHIVCYSCKTLIGVVNWFVGP